MKSDANPLHPTQRPQNAPRCSAKSKRSGMPCRAPAVKGWAVCRMHGARGGQKEGVEHSQYKHGGRSIDILMVRRLSSALAREARDDLGT